jgi:hypothetical protein
MPIYEFFSPETNKVYSFFARSSAHADRVPRCPDGDENSMRKMVSAFAITGRAKEKTDDLGGMGDDLTPQQEAEMMKLAGEMGSLDEENPDPRALGRLMRKMTEIAGEKVPEDMSEMLQRLEAGENLEKLEEQFGDALGEDGGMGDADGMMPPGFAGGGKDAPSTMRKVRRAPTRDPNLYEMNDWV